MKKILLTILTILFIFLAYYFIFSIVNKPADEKVKGVWTYFYDEDHGQVLELRSEEDGLYVAAKGGMVEVYPLKKQTNDSFDFLLEGKHNKKYLYNVKFKDKNHIIISPDDENSHSLAEVLAGTNELSTKALKDGKNIELKKNEK